MSDDLERMEARLAAMPQVMERETRHAMQASLLLIEADARRGAPQDTRRLSGSITSTIVGTFPTLEGRVGPSVRYGAPVEFGRRAGAKMPPVDALLGWVRRHGGGTPRQVRSRAFLLARAIGRRGIRPQPYMGPALDRNRRQIVALFQRAGARVVASLGGRG